MFRAVARHDILIGQTMIRQLCFAMNKSLELYYTLSGSLRATEFCNSWHWSPSRCSRLCVTSHHCPTDHLDRPETQWSNFSPQLISSCQDTLFLSSLLHANDKTVLNHLVRNGVRKRGKNGQEKHAQLRDGHQKLLQWN